MKHGSKGSEESLGTMDIEADAASWDTRLRIANCSEEEREAFEQWRNADPAHREAFEELQQIVTALRNEKGRPELRSLRDHALAAANQRGKRWRWAMAAGLVVSATGAVLWLIAARYEAAFSLDDDSYVTGVGQRSNVRLPDGSSIELNAKTRVLVAFDRQRRLITLQEGQAIFRVAHSASRPFIVRAGHREIRALGTSFDVQLQHSAVRVTLLEGKVAITAEKTVASQSKPLILTAGEQLVTSTESPGSTSDVVREIDVAKVTAWQQGDIHLDDLSLAEAVAEMNKYSAVQIALDDPRLARLRVNGMFTAGEQQVFVTALESYFPIRADVRGDGTILLREREK